MSYKDFIIECKNGMRIYGFKNGSMVCSYLFFEEKTLNCLNHQKFFDKKRRLKKFLNEVIK